MQNIKIEYVYVLEHSYFIVRESAENKLVFYQS